MANKTFKPTSEGKSLAWSVTEDDLKDLQEFQLDLLTKADEATKNGRLYISSMYVKMVAMVSPEIKRIRDRFDRETLASTRKELKQRKIEAREAEDAVKDTLGQN